MNTDLSAKLVKMAEEDRAASAALSTGGSPFDCYHPMLAELRRRNAERLSAIFNSVVPRLASAEPFPVPRLSSLDDSFQTDALFGAPWLPTLYFAFGVVVAVLAEIAAKDWQPSVKSSVSGMPAPR